MQTVRVEMMSQPNAVKLIWEHEVDKADVAAAFDDLLAYLNAAQTQVYVFVDILSNPQFPLRETITHALWKAFRHQQLEEWLVIGSNPLASAIERTLSGITRRKNVMWFKSEAEALAYLKNKEHHLSQNWS